MKKVVLLAVAFAMAITCTVAFAADEKPEVVYGTNVGDLSKPVDLKSIDGKSVIKTNALPKTTVLMLVSSVCTACTAELREVAANLDQFKDKDVYAVVIDMDPSRAAESMSSFKLQMLSDADWNLGAVTGLTSAPSTVILSKEGKILFKTFGYSRGQFKEYMNLK